MWHLLLFLSAFAAPGDGLLTAENGNNPKGESYTLKLTKTLDIGPDDGDDRYLWTGEYATVDVDAAGNMYVMDSVQNRILVFTPEGAFLKQIGRKGQGPGEFLNLRNFQILTDGSAVAFEFLQMESSIHYFDAAMKFVERSNNTSQKLAYRDTSFSPDGAWFSSNTISLDFKGGKEIVRDYLLDKNHKPQLEVMKNVLPVFKSESITKPKYWATFIASRIKADSDGLYGYIAFDTAGNIYSAAAHKYEVTKYDNKLNKLMVFSRTYKPIARKESEIVDYLESKRESYHAQLPGQFQFIMTTKLMEMARKKADFKMIKPPIFGLCAMEDGTTLVIHDFNFTTNQSSADIFSPQGIYLGSFNHSGPGMKNMIFKGGKAYTLEEIDDDRHLVRYDYELVPVH